MKLTTHYDEVFHTLFLEASLGEGASFSLSIEEGGKCRLYEIPQYGGDQRVFGEFDCPIKAIKEALSWT